MDTYHARNRDDQGHGCKGEAGQSSEVFTPPPVHHIGNGCLKEDTRSRNRVSFRKVAEIPRAFQLSGYSTTTLKPPSHYLENAEDNTTQDYYHISSSKPYGDEGLLPDNILSEFSFRHEGNAPELVGYGMYSGSSLTVNRDQKPQEQATTFSPSWAKVKVDRHCHRPSKSLDTALVINGHAGADELKNEMDWHQKPISNTRAEVQSTPELLSLATQQLSHGKLAIRSILKPEFQGSQCSPDGSPHASSTNQTTERYDERINNSKTLGGARDEILGFTKHRLSGLLDARSLLAPSTQPAAPNLLSTLKDKVGRHLRIGSWASQGDIPDPKPLFVDCLAAPRSLSHGGSQGTLIQCGSGSHGSNSGQPEFRPSKDASRTDQNGRPGKRKRLFGRGRNGEGTDDENDDGDDSAQRKPGKTSIEYSKKGLLACPFYKNDPAYFAGDFFHDGKYFICAARGFPDIARLKEHIYRKHSLPHTCSRCGDTFKSKSALDNHLPVRNPEKITCQIRILPPSKTKGLTPDAQRELKNRSKNGATPTMEAIWIDMYKKLFPGIPLPSSGPYLKYAHGSSWGIGEREEYIQYSEQKLPVLVQEELDATGRVLPEHRDLLISVMKSCQQKLRGMFHQASEPSGARLASEDRSLASMIQSNETLREIISRSSTSTQGRFQPDSESISYRSEDHFISTSQFREISTGSNFSPDVSPDRHSPSEPGPDSGYNSKNNSLSKGSKSKRNHLNSGFDSPDNQNSSSYSALNNIFPPSGGDGFLGSMLETFDNSPMEFDDHLSDPAHTAASDPARERGFPGEHTESIASNTISGPDAESQASGQSYGERFDRDIMPFRR